MTREIEKKAITILKNMSNKELQKILSKFGYNISINIITRGFVESEIKNKLSSYSESQIKEFIEKYL